MGNVEAALALFDSIRNDDLEAGAAWFAEDAEWVELPIGLVYRGPRGWHENVLFWRKSFADGEAEVTNVIDGGDTVVVEYVGRGTSVGPTVTPLGTYPATGGRVEAGIVDVWEFRDGRIARGRSYVGGLVAGLGAPR